MMAQLSPREQHARHAATRCVNYNGTVNEKCKAGVAYYSLVPLEGSLKTLPCFKDNNAIVTCEACRFLTPEEVETDCDEFEARMNRFAMVLKATKDHAKGLGLKKGNGGYGNLPCPTGCGGTLRYSVASYNGHMHASCSTKGCVSWME